VQPEPSVLGIQRELSLNFVDRQVEVESGCTTKTPVSACDLELGKERIFAKEIGDEGLPNDIDSHDELDSEGTKKERRFVVEEANVILAVYITMLDGKDVDFFAVGVSLVFKAMVLLEPLFEIVTLSQRNVRHGSDYLD